MHAWSVAKSRPTLCDPMGCSPPGSSVLGIFPGKNTGECSHSLLQGIFLTQGLNLCLLSLLHWQASYLPVCHLSAGKRKANMKTGLHKALSKCWKRQDALMGHLGPWSELNISYPSLLSTALLGNRYLLLLLSQNTALK